MSRIGKNPITVPAGVTVEIADGNAVTVKGKLGALTRTFSPLMQLSLDGGTLTVARPDDERQNRALHGLTRTLLHNMVVGVSEGYQKKLEIEGVGYKAEKQGAKLVLSLGYSHPIFFEEKNGITFEVPSSTVILVKGIDKELVGQIAADIRAKRPPEPYLGKGVRYAGEHIRRKAGKTGK
ncbi:MAG: 50S ribosomal protein L6 [Clostridia bacterium]|nr:50S ribosomal protein L6 [Clostridia bacterium]